MSESGGAETRRVTLTQLKSGVQLRVGRDVVLVVDGDSGAANEAADPPGTEGGVEGGPFAIEVQLTAAGGTPLAAERVRIVDPDTDEQVGKPAVTDEQGILRARVPAEKEYQFFPVLDEPEDHPDPWSAAAKAPVTEQEHSVLLVALADAGGEPLKAEKVTVKDEAGEAHELQTDEEGHIRLVTDPGAYEVEVKGTTFVAHTLFTTDLGEDPKPYRFSLA